MERYLQQLIEDLRQAHGRAPHMKAPEEKTDEDVQQELGMIDSYVSGDRPEPTPYNLFGIDPALFPPAEKLSTEQKILLAEEILALWGAFHIDAVYPKKFPLERLYPMLVKYFREPFFYIPGGFCGLEFCHYDPEECPFGEEYCTCKDIEIYEPPGE